MTAHAETQDHSLVHPSDMKYVGIALVLAAITSFEIALFYLEKHIGWATAPLLIAGSLAKFCIVVLYFMHLKFDIKMIKVIFVSGCVMALVYFGALLMSMGAIFGRPAAPLPTNEPLPVVTGR